MANFLDETWQVLLDENGQPLLDDVEAIPASLAGQSLDTLFAAAQALGQLPEAYTTGTATNAALLRTVAVIEVTLSGGLTAAETALAAATLNSPAAVLSAVAAAGNLAAAVAALADTVNTNTVLSRP